MNRPVKVLVLNSCVNGGGAGHSLAALLNAPDGRVDVHVAMPQHGVMGPRFERSSTVHIIPEFVERMRRSPYDWPDRLGLPWVHGLLNIYALARAVAKLVRLARDLPADVIYCNHMLAKPIGVFVGAVLGIPVVFHSRASHSGRIDAAFYSWLGARRCVKRIICNSHASARAYQSRSAGRIVIIPNGLDLRLFSRAAVAPRLRAEHALPAGACVIGFVGRLHPKKGVDWLLRAFARIAGQRDNLFLAVVGGNDGSVYRNMRREYETLAETLGIAERVRFTGFRDDVRPYLMDFDVLVFPSRQPESFGRVLLEGMALSIPVVTAAHGGAIEVVEDREQGLWVEVESIAGLARSLIELVDDPRGRRRMGDAGRRRVEKLYDARGVAARVWNVLLEAAGERPTPEFDELGGERALG